MEQKVDKIWLDDISDSIGLDTKFHINADCMELSLKGVFCIRLSSKGQMIRSDFRVLLSAWLCHADETAESFPWLPLLVRYGCAHA